MAPLPRFDKLAPDKQRQIVDAAATEFAEHGYEQASLNRIIAAAGISKGAMYYYFADKADLYGAVLDDVLHTMGESFEGFGEPADADAFWQELAALTDRVNEVVFADPQLAALARGLYQSGSANEVYRGLLERTARWVAEILERGRAVGAVRDDVPLGLLTEALTGMLVAMDRWFVQAMDQTDPEELMRLVPKTLELVQDLVRPPG